MKKLFRKIYWRWLYFWRDRPRYERLSPSVEWPSGNPWPLTGEDFKLKAETQRVVFHTALKGVGYADKSLAADILVGGHTTLVTHHDMRLHRRVIRFFRSLLKVWQETETVEKYI